jgi:hypothetical protein
MYNNGEITRLQKILFVPKWNAPASINVLSILDCSIVETP